VSTGMPEKALTAGGGGDSLKTDEGEFHSMMLVVRMLLHQALQEEMQGDIMERSRHQAFDFHGRQASCGSSSHKYMNDIRYYRGEHSPIQVRSWHGLETQQYEAGTSLQSHEQSAKSMPWLEGCL